MSAAEPSNPHPEASGTVNHYKFTHSTHSVRSGQAGLERDAESGLDHTWFRQYSSAQGRWLTPDMLAGSIFNPQSVNRYAYVGNGPLNAVDPQGLVRTPWAGGGGGVCDITGGGDTVDGLASGCGGAQAFLGMGAAVQCPSNVCSGYATDPKTGKPVYVQFYAFAGGTTGYFRPSDVGQGVHEWAGRLYTAKGWQQLTQAYVNDMRAMLAAILGLNPSQLTSLGLQGGNAFFALTPEDWARAQSANGTCEPGAFGIRCSDNNLHFGTTEENGVTTYWVHMDSGDPYTGPWGTVVHVAVDVMGGHTVFQAGVPH